MLNKTATFYLIIAAVFAIMQAGSFAQGLAVAVGPENTIAGGGAYDGTNFLLTIIGDSAGTYNIDAQFIGPGPVLFGSRFSTGKVGSGTKMAFDGTNFLMLWTDPFPYFAGGDTNGIGNVYGQFITTSGQLLGSTFQVASNVNIKFGQGRGTFSFNDSTYFVTYDKGGVHQDYLYGQRISKAGTLLGAPVQISANYAREHTTAFDGTNYLIAWCEGSGVDEIIYGQFINETGTLVGNNFIIDGSPNKSDNPLSMTYDGSQYFVLFHDQAADTTGSWNLYGRFVSKSGDVNADRILICDSTKSPEIPLISSSGSDYLITWIELGNVIRVDGRFYNKSGAPLDTAFIIFDTLGGKFPLGGVAGYIPGHYILGVTRFNSQFSDGDIYIDGINPFITGISSKENNKLPSEYSLSQNYPNPFNPTTNIEYTIIKSGLVTIKIYDLLGNEIATLVNQEKSPGKYQAKFDGAKLSSGVYFYRIETGNFSATKKLVLLK